MVVGDGHVPHAARSAQLDPLEGERHASLLWLREMAVGGMTIHGGDRWAHHIIPAHDTTLRHAVP
jgi:hypothetical protein